MQRIVSIQLILISLLLSNELISSFLYNTNKISSVKSFKPSSRRNLSTIDLEKCLMKEYASFFSPMDKRFYTDDVVFEDPLTSLSGVSNYENNVNLLAGRTGLGKLLFKDASISLHNIIKLDEYTIQTRWTLSLTVNILPWKPRPRFTGVSIYSINGDGKVIKQTDYWDSINLINGKYEKVSFNDGFFDFIGQIQDNAGAEMAAQELPVSLLRNSPLTFDSIICLLNK